MAICSRPTRRERFSKSALPSRDRGRFYDTCKSPRLPQIAHTRGAAGTYLPIDIDRKQSSTDQKVRGSCPLGRANKINALAWNFSSKQIAKIHCGPRADPPSAISRSQRETDRNGRATHFGPRNKSVTMARAVRSARSFAAGALITF
jgi:hypothetical protein